MLIILSLAIGFDPAATEGIGGELTGAYSYTGATSEAWLDFYQAQGREESIPVLASVDLAIFAGHEPRDDWDAATRILAYISQWCTRGTSWNRTGSQFWECRVGICSQFANGYVASCRLRGIPSRVVNLRNTGTSMTHTLAEVYIDGEWRCVDPTFGCVFSTSYWPTGPDVPERRWLSFRDCLLLGDWVQAFQVTAPIWSGTVTSYTFAPLDESLNYSALAPWALARFYRRSFAQAFPAGTMYDGAVHSYPLDIDGMGDMIGTPNGLCEMSAPMDWPNMCQFRYRSAPWVGNAGHSTAIHTLTIRRETPGRVRVVYRFIHDHPQTLPGVVPLRGAIMTRVETEPRAWLIEFDQRDTEAILLVQALGDGAAYWVDYIEVTPVD